MYIIIYLKIISLLYKYIKYMMYVNVIYICIIFDIFNYIISIRVREAHFPPSSEKDWTALLGGWEGEQLELLWNNEVDFARRKSLKEQDMV